APSAEVPCHSRSYPRWAQCSRKFRQTWLFSRSLENKYRIFGLRKFCKQMRERYRLSAPGRAKLLKCSDTFKVVNASLIIGPYRAVIEFVTVCIGQRKPSNSPTHGQNAYPNGPLYNLSRGERGSCC